MYSQNIYRKNLEEVVSVDQIRGYKDLPMRTFESKIWEAFGCRRDYIKEEDRVKVNMS
jgi:RNA-dependent RNA polymerase